MKTNISTNGPEKTDSSTTTSSPAPVHSPGRRLCLQALGSALAASALPLHAQTSAASDWPSRPVRFVIGNAGGDPNDMTLRRFLQSAGTEMSGFNGVVDNKPGAGGILAHQEVLRSAADGYTVLMGNAGITILPAAYKKLPYNPLAEFVPVAFSGMTPLGLAIPATRPEKTFKEWLAAAKKQKGKLNYGSGGNGSVPHLYGFDLSDTFELEATHIAQRGSAPALRDLAGGSVDYIVLDILSLRGLVLAGQARVLAVTGTERTRHLPDVPTFKELGVEGFERMGWNAFYVKAGTPQAMIDRLSALTNKVMARPDWVALREQLWYDWKPMPQSEIVAQIKRETEGWGKVIKRSGYTAD